MGVRTVRIKAFAKHNAVMLTAFAAAAVTVLFVPVDSAYAGYLDMKTLICLFCVLAVVCALRDVDFFYIIACRIVRVFKTSRMCILALVFISFLGSMLITNDAALLTFLPLGYFVLSSTGKEKYLPFTFIMQNMAANLGGMLMPFGNPQNLYLYNRYGFSMGTFLSAIAPYSVLSLALLAGSCLLFLPVQPIAPPRAQCRIQSPGRLGAYCLLFGVNLLTVLRILNPWILLGVICIALLLLDRSLFRKADYSLLLTFVFFFIFVGNMGNIPALSGALQRFLQGRELLTAVLASQVISNVPAAILLSGLSEDGRALLIGTNLGGLGTLIASMASLITYKLYAAAPGSQPKRYMGVFTLCNLAYLAALLLLYAFI